MAKRIVELPFLRGQDEGVDPKLLAAVAPQGTLMRAVNVRLRKDGRLGTRRDYDALPMTAYAGTLVAYDLVNFDGRLVALGDCKGRGYPSDVFGYVASAAGWAGSENDGDKRFGEATKLRDMGRLPATGSSCTYLDVAATGGYVCLVSSDDLASYVHVFKASTGETLLVERSTTNLFWPRVVAVGGVFYLGGLTSAGTSINLRSINPATQTATQTLSTPFGVANAIVAWDLTANVAGTEIVAAVARTGPTTQIQRISTAGATLQTIAGPATLEDFVTVYNDGTRIHFVDVVDTTRIVRISTYAVAGGALQNGPTTLFSGATSLQQASIAARDASNVRVFGQIDSTNTVNPRSVDVNIATHALTAANSRWDSSYLTTKAFAKVFGANAFADHYFGGRFVDPDCTNFLGSQGSEMVIASKEHYTGAEELRQLPHLAVDASTGRMYWPQVVQDVDALGTALVTEWELASTDRMQTASIGGHLYVASGAPLVYDGREVAESGFEDAPVIYSVTGSNGAGLLTPNGLYSVAVTWEKTDALGHLHTSAPSAIGQVTLGPSEDTITVVCSSPHSIRRNVKNQAFGGAVKVVVWCTSANGTVLQRGALQFATNAGFGDTITLTVLGPDSTLEAEEVLYTQGARGALSGPLPFECPLPSRYIWASKERLLAGGQPYGPQVQESRALFPNEPIQWSLGLGFFATVRGDVTAVAILDEQRYVFTAEEVFSVPGEGIDDTGNGTLGPPVKLPSECGCIDWRSMVEIGAGLLFQGDRDKIYLLPRGGGSPVWVGQPVRDTLAAFPVITSATFCRADQTVCFTCNAADGESARIVVFDTRAQTWFIDEPALGEGGDTETYRASCAYQGRLVVALQDGTVKMQSASETPNTDIPVTLETPDIRPGGVDGWAQIYGVSLLAEYRGPCVLRMSYSVDCGQSYTPARQYTLTGLAVGERVRKTWTLGPFQAESIRVMFTTTALPGTPTAGIVWNSFAVIAEPVEGLARVPAESQG